MTLSTVAISTYSKLVNEQTGVGSQYELNPNVFYKSLIPIEP